MYSISRKPDEGSSVADMYSAQNGRYSVLSSVVLSTVSTLGTVLKEICILLSELIKVD